ncbi:hypothetical protein V6N12_042471 [Hibiscus sabdariffa]|uniref:HTH cro/C1-type domain-containing protein n=1 Tax=Hibiscus sabdariffa TaxID=183260 RepID=A0ABR2EEV5_9ROSI
MAGIGPFTQDWEPIVIRKKAPNAATKKDEKVVNAARRAGAEIESVKKSNAGTNRAASSSTTLNTRKLDEETENLAHDRVPTELKKAIMQARMDKKLTQAQLAQLINEKPQIIQEYESGKAIPNQQIIGKLERALGTKLRGKKLPLFNECGGGVFVTRLLKLSTWNGLDLITVLFSVKLWPGLIVLEFFSSTWDSGVDLISALNDLKPKMASWNREVFGEIG